MFENILITSLCPDHLNSNSIIKQYLASGFRDAYPSITVHICSNEIVLKKISTIQPDLIIAIGGLVLDSIDIRSLKEASISINSSLIFWLHDDPYEFDYSYKAINIADVIFTNDFSTYKQYNSKNVFHLPMAGCIHTHLRSIDIENTRNVTLSFCGVGYPNRVSFLRKSQNILGNFNAEVFGAHWPDDLPFCRNKRLSTGQLSDLASRSLLTLNLGRQFNIANRRFNIPASTPGPRTFEVALAGSAQICFLPGREIDQYFDTKNEIIIVDNVNDLRLALERAMDDPQWAISIARNAQKRAIKEHTYETRAKYIMKTLNSYLKSEFKND